MSDSTKELLKKRKDRTIATILGVKERECDPFLPAEASHALRKVVLDTINDFYDVCLDAINSASDDAEDYVENAEYIRRRLDLIYEELAYGDHSRSASEPRYAASSQ